MKRMVIALLVLLGMSGCMSFPPNGLPTAPPPVLSVKRVVVKKVQPTDTPVPQSKISVPANNWVLVPNFDHIILIVLENEYLQNTIGSPLMPNLNYLAKQNVLLSNYFAVAHPSLPNDLALISGSTQNISSDCLECFVNAPNLLDEIELSGRTWKAYFEDMPSPCFVGSKKPYQQWVNPFIYFDSIRLDPSRCDKSIVPMSQLSEDMKSGQLPNFIFIMPNLCNSGHDCPAAKPDSWVGNMVAQLQITPALYENTLIAITFDEGVVKSAGTSTRGQVATILISPLAKPGFVDDTLYSHYSLLKTILTAWNLPLLGQTDLTTVPIIEAPWSAPIGLSKP